MKGEVCAPHPLLWASPPHCQFARRPATPGISHSQSATTGRPLDSPTRPRPTPAAAPSPTAEPSRPRPTPAAVTTIASCSAVQDQDHLQQLCRQDQDHRQLPCLKTKESREGRREKLPRQHSFLCCLSFPEEEEERRNCHVSTASLLCCQLSAVLSVAAAAATCVCRN